MVKMLFVKWFIFGLFVSMIESKIDSKSDSKSNLKSGQRDGKIFSLFTVVNFKNEACTSTASLAVGQTAYRNGTCYTSSECSQKGGSSKGSCAAGFGVCCVFTYDSDSATINVNDSYLQNPGYPSTYSESNSISYTIQKCSDDICWIRLDFEQFTLNGPADSTETDGGACTDQFTVTTSTTSSPTTYPVICGENSGQHIYIDIGRLASDTAGLKISPSGDSTSRKWDIKVSQIPCDVNYAPTNGCLQYQTGLTGRIKTFNFDSTGTAQQHLASQFYASCIRLRQGFCCVQYQVCADDGSFSFDNHGTMNPMPALQGTNCINTMSPMTSIDYITIENSNAGCGGGIQGSLNSRYCGGYLNDLKDAKGNVPICDCTAPFEVNINFDNQKDVKSDDATTMFNRGLCLEYSQIPCSSTSP